jgi:hypothetical protein
MTRKTSLMKILAAALIVGSVLSLAAVKAGADTSSDPLVTLSYLNGTYRTNLLTDVNSAVAAGQKTLSADLAGQISGLQSSMSAAKPATASNPFQTVTLAAGKSVSVSAGAQILFLSGTAKPNAQLSDTTDGTTYVAGAALKPNHLYIAAADCAIAASGASKMLISQ